MRLSRKPDGSFEARFSSRAWGCFLRVISLYPCVPPAHHRLTRHSDAATEIQASQPLLDEALAEHRAENRRAVLSLISDPKRLTATEKGMILRLARGDLMRLIQVLNDVRVGCWIRLGSPEELPDAVGPRQKPHFYAMELAGHYEIAMVSILDRA